MIRRVFIPFEVDGVLIDAAVRTAALDTAIADLVAAYGFVRKWNFDSVMPQKGTEPKDHKLTTVRASILEVSSADGTDTGFMLVANMLREKLKSKLYLELSDKKSGKFI